MPLPRVIVEGGGRLFPPVVKVLLVEATVDTAMMPLGVLVVDSAVLLRRIEGNCVISSIPTLNSSISLNLPVEETIGPAEEEEGCFPQVDLLLDPLWM
jgi:hypothetical protein